MWLRGSVVVVLYKAVWASRNADMDPLESVGIIGFWSSRAR